MTLGGKVLKSGTRVLVMFGGQECPGTILYQTITGRYMIEFNVEGADEPLTSSFTKEELFLEEA